MKVVGVIENFLGAHDIDCVFGVSGANIEDLFSNLSHNDHTKVILAKNEYNAALMAMGYYLKTKKIAAVLTTSGAGVLNALPALCEAYSSHLPLVLISGMPPKSLQGNGAFQDTSGLSGSLNIQTMLNECTQSVLNLADHIDDMNSKLSTLYKETLKTKLPTALLINKDLFQQDVTDIPVSAFDKETIELNQADIFIDRNELINADEKVVVLGEELLHSYDKDLLISFCEAINAKILTVPVTKGLIDARVERFVGTIGIMGDDESLELLKSTKTIVFLGVRFDFLTQFSSEPFSDTQKVYLVGEHKSFVKAPNLITLTENPIKFLKSFDLSIKKTSLDIQDLPKSTIPDELLKFNSSVAIFNNHLTPKNDVFIDAGNTGAFFCSGLRTYGDALFYISLGMGGMGNSVGAAIGASIKSDDRSYVFIGDGSFMIHGLEIHTALENKLPITFVILNNNSHGMCTTREDIFTDEITGINNFSLSFFGRGLGEMFKNLNSYDLDTTDQLDRCLLETHESTKPVLISLNINDNSTPPFRAFKK